MDSRIWQGNFVHEMVARIWRGVSFEIIDFHSFHRFSFEMHDFSFEIADFHHFPFEIFIHFHLKPLILKVRGVPGGSGGFRGKQGFSGFLHFSPPQKRSKQRLNKCPQGLHPNWLIVFWGDHAAQRHGKL